MPYTFTMECVHRVSDIASKTLGWNYGGHKDEVSNPYCKLARSVGTSFTVTVSSFLVTLVIRHLCEAPCA